MQRYAAKRREDNRRARRNATPRETRSSRRPQGPDDDGAFWTVYWTPPPDPKARRRRRILLRISIIAVLSFCSSIPIAVAVVRARVECSADIRCRHAHQWLLRHRDASMRRKNETTVLMIVAHPDDEVVWGGEFLLEHGNVAHVVVTSTEQEPSPKTTTTTQSRADEFRRSSDLLKFRGEFLWGKDRFQAKPWRLERSIRRRITSRICDHSWERIVTHGYEGEFGHPQHHAVHDAVLDAVHYCCNSTARLYVFQPDPFVAGPRDWATRRVYSDDKARVASTAYRSRSASGGVDINWFENWTESVVPYEAYDAELAERACRTYNVPGKLGLDNTCRIKQGEVGGGGGASGGSSSGKSSGDSSELFAKKRVLFRAKGRGC